MQNWKGSSCISHLIIFTHSSLLCNVCVVVFFLPFSFSVACSVVFEFSLFCLTFTIECNGMTVLCTPWFFSLLICTCCVFFFLFFNVLFIWKQKKINSIFLSFTEFGNTWLSTGCIADPVIVWPVIIPIDTMLRSKTTNSSFNNEFESDIVGGDGTLLCSYWSRQVVFFHT